MSSAPEPGLLYPRRYTTTDLQKVCVHPIPRAMKFARLSADGAYEKFSGIGCGACGKVLSVTGRVRRVKLKRNFSITYIEE